MPTVTTLSGQNIAVSLLSRDFESYRSDVLDSGGLADLYTPNWTDRSELDLGVALTEVFCFLSDNLAFYQDRCANEALFPSVTQRRSMIEHCKGIGYSLSPNTSASVGLTIVTNAAGVVTALSQVSVDTSDGSTPETFELESDFVSTGAGTYTGLIALHGTTIQNESIGTSDGKANQEVTLAQSPLTSDPSGTPSIEVWVDEGTPEQWSLVSNFLNSEASDKVYRIEIDENDVVSVIFPNGVRGKIPNAGATYTATYRIGGGTSGNQVGADRLTKLSGSYSFVDSVTNPAKPSGGLAKESIEEAKVNAPESLVAMDRGVRHGDYAYLAKQVPGVSKAFAHRGTGAYEEVVVIAAGGSNPVPTGSWNPYTEVGTGLIGNVGIEITSKKTTPLIIWVRGPQIVDIHLGMTVYLFDNFRKTDVQQLIETEIEAEFTAENQDFNQKTPLSRIYDIVEGVSGVDYLDVDRFQRKPYARQIDGSASLTFNSFIYGQTTQRDTWTIDFINTTQFRIYSANNGYQASLGTVGAAYLSDDSSFGFTVTGSPTAAEKWEIVTGPYAGNILPEFDELVELLNDDFTLLLVGGAG